MNEILPYVADKEKFISHIKVSMKENLCRSIALDCWIHDLTCMDDSSCILTQKGFEYFKKKYKKEIDVLLNDMAEQAKKEAIESNKRIDEYIQSNKNNEYTCIPPKDANELPFS